MLYRVHLAWAGFELTMLITYKSKIQQNKYKEKSKTYGHRGIFV
jgi:hypothetical protein